VADIDISLNNRQITHCWRSNCNSDNETQLRLRNGDLECCMYFKLQLRNYKNWLCTEIGDQVDFWPQWRDETPQLS